MTLYLEDLAPGLVFTGGPLVVTQRDVVDFGRQFDPQHFDTDPETADSSFFGGLAASGWHTAAAAALSMRMAVESPLNEFADGLIGIEVRSLRWPRPTRPGDTLGSSSRCSKPDRRARARAGHGSRAMDDAQSIGPDRDDRRAGDLGRSSAPVT